MALVPPGGIPGLYLFLIHLGWDLFVVFWYFLVDESIFLGGFRLYTGVLSLSGCVSY